jgi:hypothetical protein
MFVRGCQTIGNSLLWMNHGFRPWIRSMAQGPFSMDHLHLLVKINNIEEIRRMCILWIRNNFFQIWGAKHQRHQPNHQSISLDLPPPRLHQSREAAGETESKGPFHRHGSVPGGYHLEKPRSVEPWRSDKPTMWGWQPKPCVATLGVMGYDGCAASPSPDHSMPPTVGLDPFISGRPFFLGVWISCVCQGFIFAPGMGFEKLETWKLWGKYHVCVEAP